MINPNTGFLTPILTIVVRECIVVFVGFALIAMVMDCDYVSYRCWRSVSANARVKAASSWRGGVGGGTGDEVSRVKGWVRREIERG